MDGSLASALTGSFVIANLGASGDTDYQLPPALLKTITLIQADAGPQPIGTTNQYHKKYTVRDIVAGNKTPRQFTLRRFWGCSSIYEPRQELIEQYGLQKYFVAISFQDVVPITLPEILKECGVESVDYLKTDLEGVDFEVIRSCDDFMDRILAIKCELRFQPFFHGEPSFHEVVDYLQQRDFELIGLKPAYWKPVTRHRTDHRDGRAVFADCLFLKRIEAVRRLPSEIAPWASAKQVIIAAMSAKKCYGEYLVEQYRDILPDRWWKEISSLVTPRPMHGSVGRLIEESAFLCARIFRRLREAMRNQKDQKGFDHSYVAPGE